MKKNILLLIALIMANFAFPQSQQISSRDASDAASTWIRVYYPEYQSRKNVVSLQNTRGCTLLYEVGFDSIHILLSGSKACLPILGYYKGNSSIINEMDKLPCNLRSLIDTYIEEIEGCFANDTIRLYYNDDWNTLLNGTLSGTRSSVVVPPLITTKWNQSWSNDGCDLNAYNYFIPPDDNHNCSHQLVGCNAVALAQVMNYWQYPILYNAPRQFDWCNMTDSLNECTDGDYEIHRDAIAYLMYQCAMDIEAEFGCTGTISNLQKTRKALVEKYGYRSSASYLQRSSYYTSWEAMLRDNLDNEQPVIYRGKGHAFVCDGYRDDGTFHFNWGWCGYYDGYFSLSSLTPSDYDFTGDQAAIFNIYPSASTLICSANLNLGDFYRDKPSLLQDSLPYAVVPQTMTSLTSAPDTSSASWRTIPSGATALYQAQVEVNLEDGFEAEYGSEFEVRIKPCKRCDELRDVVVNDDNERDDDNYDVEDNNGESYAMSRPQEMVIPDLFPNPTEGLLTMGIEGKAEAVLIHNLAGRPVGGWHLDVLTATSVTLDVSDLRPGTYLLTVVSPTSIRTARFVRR